MSVSVKICGLRSPEDIAAAAEAGARYIGFVFFEKSPRYVTPEHARDLASSCPQSAKVDVITIEFGSVIGVVFIDGFVC